MSTVHSLNKPSSFAKLTLCLGLFAILPACSDLEMPAVMTMNQINVSGFKAGNFNQTLGQEIADFALAQAPGSTGYCYHYVAKAIHAHLPTFLSGMHAYLAADQLATSPYFKEVYVSPESLGSLPAGAVVVWSKGSSESGHISIADGRGREISDHIDLQMTHHYGGADARVFLPLQ